MLLNPNPGSLAWPAALAMWGPGFTTERHKHHCFQMIMIMRGTYLIRGKSKDDWMRCRAALVRPDAPHEVDAQDGTVLICFVDAESELGAALGERSEGDIYLIPANQVARWRKAIGLPPTGLRVEQWIRKELLRRRTAVKVHPGVSRVLRYLRERIGNTDDFSLKTLAGISGLSQSRFMHVFTESVGVPLRPYILWLRLQRAACDLMNGVTATAAAHNAGFSDAAHLTRTFRRMLGLTPTNLALRKRKSHGFSLQSS